jgi:hypothetical protein
MKSERWWTAAELAERFGRSPRWLHDARHRNGDVPVGIVIAGKLYFAESDISEWLDLKRAQAQRDIDDRASNSRRRGDSARRPS